MIQFIFAVRQGGGASVHGFSDGLVNQIDDEFVGGADVAGGIFRRAVIAIAGSEAEDGRLGAKEIEKAEGSGVDSSLLAHGSDQGNRPRDDKAGEDLVGAAGVLAGEVKFHGQKDATDQKVSKSQSELGLRYNLRRRDCALERSVFRMEDGG